MKRYTLKLTDCPETLDPVQQICGQVCELSKLICQIGNNTINGLNPQAASQIESRYNSLLSTLKQLHQTLSQASPLPSEALNLVETLKKAFNYIDQKQRKNIEL